MKKVVIVGAGISGLATAYRLQQLGPTAAITVLEQQQRVGGNAWTERLDGFQVEAGPNGFRDNKPSTMSLCADLGLAAQLVAATEAARKNRYLFLDGRLRLLPNGLATLFRTDLLSWRAKLQLVTEFFRRNRPASADESIADFARRRLGREVADIFADSIVTGIHGGDPELLSARACFPQLAQLEEKHGSIIGGLMYSRGLKRALARTPDSPPGPRPSEGVRMWSFREGLGLLMETLRQRLVQAPTLGVAVRRIERAAERPGWTIYGEGQERWPADAVVLACPAYRQAAILDALDPELAGRIAGIPYNRLAVVALGYRAADVPVRLDGFGYIAPQRTRRAILGVQWCSSIFPERAPPGMVLLRVLCGGWQRAEVVGWADPQLVEAARAELRLALGITAAPSFQHIVRWDRALPQYQLGHLDRVAWIEGRANRYPGLFLFGNAYHGIALNDCTENAEIVAQRVARYVATP